MTLFAVTRNIQRHNRWGYLSVLQC